MNRRTALRNFAITGAAAMLLPGCFTKESKQVSIALNNLQVTGDDEELLASIAETLIPATDKPGAKEVGAHLFTLVMVDDCLDPQTKEKFLSGMRAFNTSAPVPGKKQFMEASPAEKLATLKALDKSESLEESLKIFYTTTKRYILQAFTSSEYFLTEVKQFKLVPGPVYKGCVPLSNS